MFAFMALMSKLVKLLSVACNCMKTIAYSGGGTSQANQVATRPIIISKSQEQIKIND